MLWEAERLNTGSFPFVAPEMQRSPLPQWCFVVSHHELPTKGERRQEGKRRSCRGYPQNVGERAARFLPFTLVRGFLGDVKPSGRTT